MRNPTLHAIVHEFTADSAMQLTRETAGGAEIPFEIIEDDGGRPGHPPLYCYRPLTGSFIRQRLGLLSNLPSYTAASRALSELSGADTYLRLRGEQHIPNAGRERGDAVLRCFLARVFEERSEFGLDDSRFTLAYDELERALYDGRCVTTVIASLLGVGLDHRTTELPLGDGLSLVPGTAIPDAPTEAVWGAAGIEARSVEPNILLVLTSSHDRAARPPISQARTRFRRALTALRLFERGAYAIRPIIWTRVDDGAWRPMPFGAGGGASSTRLTLIPSAQEDELRAFCNLIARRMPAGRAGLRDAAARDALGLGIEMSAAERDLPDSSGRGEIAWALHRFELGCERPAPFEALSDYLLALRALLEPEGPASGRLAQRLAVLCAQSDDRARLAERVAHAISLERAVIAGIAYGGPQADILIEELAEHLRAVLRDVICGHLDPDLCGVADMMLEDAATGVGELS